MIKTDFEMHHATKKRKNPNLYIHDGENSLNAKAGNPACYSAVSVFSHDSITCTSCHAFIGCDDACLVTFEMIKGYVDVAAQVKLHADGRMRLGRSTTSSTALLPVLASSGILTRPEPTVTSSDEEDLKEAKAIITKAKAATFEINCADITPMLPKRCASFAEPVATLMPAIASAHKLSAPSLSLTSSSISKIKITKEEYFFPNDYELSSTPSQILIDSIKKLVLEGKATKDYFSIRDEYCSTSLELNSRRLWAPAFRESMILPRFSKVRTLSELTIHRDLVLIDCHWLHSTRSVIYSEPKWESLFDITDEFSFDLGETFATENIRSDYRTESILNLTIRQQLQLRTLRSTDVFIHKKALHKHDRDEDGKLIASQLKAIRTVIDRWCEIQPRVREHRSKYLAHAEARLLLRLALAPSWHEIAELGGLIQGVEPLGDKTVSDFMKRLDIKVKEFSAPVKV